MSDFLNQSFFAVQDQLLAGLFYLRSLLSVNHLLELILATAFFYWLYTILKGTNFLRAVRPLFWILITALLAQLFALPLLAWLLLIFTLAWFLIVLLAHQAELTALINRFLMRETKFTPSKKTLREMINALTALRSNKLSAILIIRRGKSLRALIEKGLAVNQPLTDELLIQSFGAKSHLRQGAALIEGDRVISLGVLSKRLSPNVTSPALKKIASSLGAMVVALNRAGRVGILVGEDAYSHLRFTDLESLMARLLR